ncbi:nonsense-mediated mRNA decay protein [Colletotrichum truncatum]|uniref:Nonsense-mediated mRNA decay protein n=1 Tax=Colletotrichum truncatum TaxID=5467 RepID=A0ACC3Z0H3_COLTU
MVHSFLSREEFARVHREGTVIEMANEEITYSRFNNNATQRNAWVITPLPGSPSLISSDLQTRWIVLVELPKEHDKVFPDEGEDCSIGFKHDFLFAGRSFNPGMLKAQRIPNPFNQLDEPNQLYGHAAFSVTMDYMKDTITKQIYHPLEAISIPRLGSSHRLMELTPENAVKVILRVTPQFITHETELKALAFLMDHNRDLSLLEKRASQTFEYILDFRKPPSFWVNLFQELPHMESPSDNPLTPNSLRLLYEHLNSDHKKVYEQLHNIPAGLALILGCPGAGKTALNAFIAAMALSQPIVETVDGKRIKRLAKILYVLDVNDPCDDAANRVYRTCKEADLPALVIRVRGCAREMSRSTKLHPSQKAGNKEVKSTPDFTFGFLKQARLAQQNTIARRDFTKAPSLDEAAWEMYEANTCQYKGLSTLLMKLNEGATKTKRTVKELKARVSRLYFDVIKKADFIATTPVGVSGQLSTHFKPDIVFVDEAAHARELTSLVPLAFSPARAYIFTGDTRQTRPFVQGASMTKFEIMEKGLRKNPYAKQLMISTMERADLAGGLSSKLLITHRMYGNLHLLASELFYDGLLKSGISNTDRFPKVVQHIQTWLQQFAHDQNLVVPRLLINHCAAQEETERKSFYNPVHETFITQRCLELLCDQEFRRVDKPDEPGRVLIITPYKAALFRYKQFTASLPPHLRGRLDIEQRHAAMEARTVDSAQGHEADFVFIDTVRTKTAGFLDDPKRLCVMFTRARIGEMILMHEGMTMRRMHGALVKAEWTSKVYEHCRDNSQLCHMA